LFSSVTVFASDRRPAHRIRCGFLEPEVMGPPVVWLASDDAAGVHDERIVAAEFDRWLRARNGRP